jgi:integrase
VSFRGPTWEQLAEQGGAGLTVTMRRYLDQIALSLAEESVRSYATTLRQFTAFLFDFDPAPQSVASIDRYHLEAYKRHLAQRSTGDGAVVSKLTRRQRLRTLRVFFDRIIEWGYDDAPARNPLFHGDIPRRDEPLPRFLDDPTAAKFMRGLADEPDPFRRLSVEILARTGMRVGELCALEADAVVQIGESHWLRVPVGKLHNDRYVPLHPLIVELLDDWQTAHPVNTSGLLLFHKQRPLTRDRGARMLGRIAKRVGIPRPTPHQLRHTLATQAINRGMRLEAVAALLGHRSLAMTMIYARIADRTVADEYHAVSDKVEALYAQARTLPADAEGANMRRLREDMHRRLLGNGHCTRPAELDCHYESICETCTFFSTNAEFAPTLQRQRDHAAERDQLDRVDLFNLLLDRINEDRLTP